MFIIYALALYGVFCAFFVFVMIMGPSATWRNTFVGSINRFFVALPQNFTYWCCLVRSRFDKDMARTRTDNCYNYFVESQNPVIQIFYALLVGGALYIFYFHGVASTLSLFDLTVVNIVIAISLAFYCLAWLVDPGTVETDKDAHDKNPCNKRFAFDGIQYQEGQSCATCNIPKPARSKHCKICGRCVRRFDHHCPWINNDVGENNLKWFHAFLLSHVVMSALVAYWSAMVIVNFIDSETQRLTGYMEKRGIYDKVRQADLMPNWSILVLYSVQQKTSAGILVIFAGLIAVLLFGFWWMNFVHVWRNETTNEQHKFLDLKEYLDETEANHEKRRKAAELEKQEREKNKENQADEQDNRNNNRTKLLEELLAKEDQEEEEQANETALKNIQSPTTNNSKKDAKIMLNRTNLSESKTFYQSGSRFANIIEAFFILAKPSSEKAVGKAHEKLQGSGTSKKEVGKNKKVEESKKKK